MCIIAVKPEKVQFTKSQCRTMWNANPDGAGLMYGTGERLVVVKGLMTFDGFWSAYEEAGPLRKMVIHFRIKTHGDVNEDNTHPFWVVKNKLALAHNGVIRPLTHKTSAKESDTAVFARMLAENYKNPISVIGNSFIRSTLEAYIGYSKVVFMDKDGRTTILNEEMGKWHKNVWYSNDSWKEEKPLVSQKGNGKKSSSFDKELERIMERFGEGSVAKGNKFRPNPPVTGPTTLYRAPEHFAPVSKPIEAPSKQVVSSKELDELFKEDHELAAAMQNWKN